MLKEVKKIWIYCWLRYLSDELAFGPIVECIKQTVNRWPIYNIEWLPIVRELKNIYKYKWTFCWAIRQPSDGPDCGVDHWTAIIGVIIVSKQEVPNVKKVQNSEHIWDSARKLSFEPLLWLSPAVLLPHMILMLLIADMRYEMRIRMSFEWSIDEIVVLVVSQTTQYSKTVFLTERSLSSQ